MTAPLDNVTVIEIDNWMASPSAGAILADLGADVIKIEPLSGDPMRGMGRPAKVSEDKKDFDFQFDVSNRGKRSIAIDLESEAGMEVVLSLLAGADIFMCNLLRHRQEKFGLDPESVKQANSNIVHATLTGYGTHDPKHTDPDTTSLLFLGGLVSMTLCEKVRLEPFPWRAPLKATTRPDSHLLPQFWQRFDSQKKAEKHK
jgi:crotonobetainyl-CoA:carnitine CoA-transferase CaiB-like acyl-CoA transferase